AKATFHTTKFRLHHAVGRDVIDFDGRVYTLSPSLDAWFDVAAFRERLEVWRSTQNVNVLAEAVALYEGDFLSDCYMDWCIAEREALHMRCLEALETLAERLLARRQYRRAVRALRQALALEPARETFHQQLMRAYALSGQRSRALAQYERCRTDLDRELDAAPSHTTEELYGRILNEAPLD
ncbi:MAG: bacterial transcriptional activator domain-containing protein, partial [Anaerolineae bacterium]|nr:bacterial transcriptional activator domain-containing protein [Anaerolineae bacterium]